MIFVGTWAWVALALKRDQHHRPAKAQHKKFLKARRQYITTNFVLSEVITHLYTTAKAQQAQGFINALLVAIDTGAYQLVHVSGPQFHRAWQMRQKYHDKPDISSSISRRWWSCKIWALATFSQAMPIFGKSIWASTCSRSFPGPASCPRRALQWAHAREKKKLLPTL